MSRLIKSQAVHEVSMPDKITVLVVEDEALLRIATVDDLTQHGFEVMEASNAGEAIEIFRSGRRFECLFTDVDMPGDRDGLELAELVKSAWPPIEIIVTSGHRNVGETDLPQDGVFVGKPYNTEVIGDLIQRLTRKN
jgi:CheY-like chemotaxis protein